MKSKTKRILAFLCAVVLTATSFLGNWYSKTTEAANDPTPIQLDGFDNVTLSDFKDSNGNAMQAGDYRSDKNGGTSCESFYSLREGNLNKKLVSMKIKYHGGNAHQYSLLFGGKGTYTSFNLRPSGDGKVLYIDATWADNIIDKSSYYENVQYMEASKAGLDSFIGEEFLLQMSFEYGEVVSGKTTLTIGMYINGELYSGGKHTILNCDVNALAGGLGVYVEYTNNQVAVISLDNVTFPIEPIQLDGFENVTLKDFKDSNGNAMQAGDYRSDKNGGTSCESFYSLREGNLNKKLVSMKIKYHGGNAHQYSLLFGGKGTYTSFNLRPSGDGKVLYIDATWADNIIDKSSYYENVQYMEASKAGLDSFIGEEFLLQMSFEYGEVVSGKTTLTIGMYINGELYSGGKHTILNCDVNALAGGLGVYVEYTNNQVAVISLDNVTFPIEPIQLDGFENVTLKDFKDSNGKAMQAGDYRSDKNGGTSCESFYSLREGNLDKKLVSMKIKYHGGNEHQYSLLFGGKGTYTSFNLRPSGNGQVLYIDSTWAGNIIDKSSYNVQYMEASKAGLDSFIGEEFLLQMSFEYGEVVSGKTTLTIGMYINGELYSGGKHTIPNCDVNALAGGLGVYVEYTNDQVAVISLDNVTFPIEPIQLNGFDNVTLSDFKDGNGNAMRAGDYRSDKNGGSAWDPFYSLPEGNLDKKLVSMKIKYHGGDDHRYSLLFGGKGTYTSFNLRPSGDGQVLYIDSTWADNIIDKSSYNVQYMEASKAGLDSFIGEEFLLQMSFEYGEVVSGKTTLTIGMYINGELYSGGKHTIPNCDVNALAGGLGVYVEYSKDQVAVISLDNVTFPEQPVEPEQPEQPENVVQLDGFTNISVEDFVDASGNVMESKEYAYANGVGRDDFQLADGTSFNKKLLSLNLNFKTSDSPTRLNVAGTSAWHGIWVYPNGSGSHLFIVANKDVNKEVDDYQAITVEAEKAGLTSFVNQEFNLQLSFEFGEADGNNQADLQIGVYIDGELYEGKTNTLTKCNLGNIGNCLGVVHENEGTSVVVNNISSPEQLFDRITFSDFALETAKYEFENGVAAAGEASEYEQLDKVVFSGDFRFSATGNYQIIYAGDGGDNGLRFAIDSNNNMNVGWYQGGSGQTLFTTTAASVGLSSFAKQTFNIIVSTELIDADKDGNENDIKIGIWVNKRICASAEGAYHIVKDCGQYLLNDLVVKGDAGNVLLRNVNPFQKNPYYYEDISQYRGEEKSYPTKIGYIFSGWYADADYTEPLEPTVTSGSAYAKFVDEDVLSVKSQIKLTVDSDDDGTVDSLGSITDLRFVTTVDGLDYRRISFYIQKDGSSKVLDAATVDTNPRLVYEKLYAVGDDNRTIEYEPTAFSWQSEYFKAFSLTNIKENSYGDYVKVTPYWITMDGTVVEGKTLRTCVNEYGSDTSQAVSVAFIGDDTMPITGTYGPYAVTDSNDAGLYPNYLTAEYFKMIADSGVNVIHLGNVDYATQPEQVKTALKLAEKYGIGIYVYDSEILTKTTLNDVKARIAEYENYQSFVGMYIVDEPTTDDYKKDEGRNVSDYETITGFLKELKILTYVNMYPIVDTTDRSFWEIISGQYGITDKDKDNYSTYVNTVLNKLQPEVLMWDHYPFAIKTDDRSTVVTDHNLYLWNMAEIRSQAQSNNKPFWAYVQAGANWNDDKEYFNTLNYAPTEGQFHWNINTALAFGAQGIQYFPLIQPYHFAYAGANAEANEWDFERNGLIGAFGNKTKWYAYAQEANSHIGAMDHILMNAYNEQIIAIGSATNDISGVNGVVTSTAYKKLQSASGDEALIGCFDYKGKTALYVVNYDYNNAGTVRLQFTGEYNVTMIKNAEESTTKAQEITLTNMEPGEGVLLVIE